MHTIKFNRNLSHLAAIFGIMPKQNLMGTSISVISTSNLVRYMALIL